MLILTCCYLFLYFCAVIQRSPSMLRFSFPTLTLAVWLNQSDRLWAPGESLSLSLHSPLSPQVYASCDKLILAPFEMQCSPLDGPSVVSSHSRTGAHTKTKCTHSAENMPRHAQTHTQVHAGTGICEDINTHKMQLESRTHSIPPAHILCLTPLSPITLLIPL